MKRGPEIRGGRCAGDMHGFTLHSSHRVYGAPAMCSTPCWALGPRGGMTNFSLLRTYTAGPGNSCAHQCGAICRLSIGEGRPIDQILGLPLTGYDLGKPLTVLWSSAESRACSTGVLPQKHCDNHWSRMARVHILALLFNQS